MNICTNKNIPPKSESTIDRGTKELLSKKRANLTQIPLDILRDRLLINAKQHKAALQLRYLYNLRFSFLNLRTYNPANDYTNSRLDPKYMIKKQALYKKAVEKLRTQNHVLNIVFNISIFDLFPSILLIKTPHPILQMDKFSNARTELDLLKNGLDSLIKVLNIG